MYCNVRNKYRKSKKTKKSYILTKALSRSIVYNKYGYEYEKVFKKEESIEILKNLGLINDIEEVYNHAWRRYK